MFIKTNNLPHPHIYQEKELLARVAGGDEVAFAVIFNEWYPRLLAYILKVTGSRETSEEVVQDVFTKIWLRRAELVGVDNFQAYLFVAARHHALNELEKIAVYYKALRGFIREQPVGLPVTGEHTQMELLERAAQRLSPRQREIWLLHRREQYTYDDIARQLGISRETVKTHLQTAVFSITEYLKGKEALLLLLALGSW